jgi:hypothetical protein
MRFYENGLFCTDTNRLLWNFEINSLQLPPSTSAIKHTKTTHMAGIVVVNVSRYQKKHSVFIAALPSRIKCFEIHLPSTSNMKSC